MATFSDLYASQILVNDIGYVNCPNREEVRFTKCIRCKNGWATNWVSGLDKIPHSVHCWSQSVKNGIRFPIKL